MGYLLVAPDVLDAKGIKYYERIPDGRGIVDFSMLRVIGSVESVQIVGSKRELDKIIMEQKESGMYDTPTILPEIDGELADEIPVDEIPVDETPVDEDFSVDPEMVPEVDNLNTEENGE